MSSLMTVVKKANPLHRAPGGVAIALGCVGIGLGLAALLTPARVERRSGLRPGPATRLAGLRQIATGIGTVNAADRAPWLAATMAGHALDIATLLRRRQRGAWSRTLRTLAAAAGAMALDAATAAAIKNKAQHDRAAAWDYSDRVGIRRRR